MSPLADGETADRRRLLDLAEFHRATYGDETVEAEDWLDEDTADDPVELAGILEIMADTKALVRIVEEMAKARLEELLGGGAVRSGDVVYVRGASSGRWKPTRELWEFVDGIEVELPSVLDAIVSGIRVTAIDRLAEDAGIDKTAVRDTFLDYSPGRLGIQRKDLGVENVRKAAARWWPETDGQITYPLKREETNDE